MRHAATYMAAIAMILALALPARAGEITFEATVDRSVVSVAEQFHLSLTFTGTTRMPAPPAPEVEGLRIAYIGPSSMMSIVNGQMTSSVTHRYSVIPMKAGEYTIPSVLLNHEGVPFRSRPVRVRVEAREGRQGGEGGGGSGGASLDEMIRFELTTSKDRVYVGERFDITLRLLIGGVRVQNLSRPDFAPRGLDMEPFGEPTQYSLNKDGMRWQVVQFQTAASAREAGRLRLPSAIAGVQLAGEPGPRARGGLPSPFMEEFFGARTVPYDAISGTLDMEVMALPEDGMPEGFGGAVGEFTLKVEVSPTEAVPGDPVTVRAHVRGTGNFENLAPPALRGAEKYKTYGWQVVEAEHGKAYEQVIIPGAADAGVPSVELAYFDVREAAYKVLRSGPLGLTLRQGDGAGGAYMVDGAGALALGGEAAGEDLLYIKPSPGAWTPRGARPWAGPWLWLAGLWPLAAIAGARLYRAHRARLEGDGGYARRRGAFKTAMKGLKELDNAAGAREAHAIVGRVLGAYVADRFGGPQAGLTSDEAHALMIRGGSEETLAGDVRDTLAQCERAVYAPQGASGGAESIGRSVRTLIERIEG